MTIVFALLLGNFGNEMKALYLVTPPHYNLTDNGLPLQVAAFQFN